METESYSSFDVARILNIKRGRLREWLSEGFIEPSIEIAEGQGTRNRFSKEDIYGIKLFNMLIQTSVSRETASRYVKQLTKGLKKIQMSLTQMNLFAYLIYLDEDGEFDFGKWWAMGEGYVLIADGLTGVVSLEIDGKIDDQNKDIHFDYVTIIDFRKIMNAVDVSIEFDE